MELTDGTEPGAGDASWRSHGDHWHGLVSRLKRWGGWWTRSHTSRSRVSVRERAFCVGRISLAPRQAG